MNDYISYISTDSFLSVQNLLNGETLILSASEVTDRDFQTAKEALEDESLPPDERFQAVYNAVYGLRDVVEEAGFDTSTLDQGFILWENMQLPSRVVDILASKAGRDRERWKAFARRLVKNPSNKVVTQLAEFLHSCPGVVITDEGLVRAFKGVRDDYYDVHSQTNLNAPGTEHEMPRNQVEDDPSKGCGRGLHLGSLDYARSWGPRVMVCEVDPADVVSVPYDHAHQKLRCCKYKVLHEVSTLRSSE